MPPSFADGVAIHYAHRLGALMVLLLVGAVVWRVTKRFRDERSLLVPTMAVAVLVSIQVALGGAVVLSSRAVFPNTVHVALGALILGTSMAMTLYAWRGVEVVEGAAAVTEPAVEPLELREAAS